MFARLLDRTTPVAWGRGGIALACALALQASPARLRAQDAASVFDTGGAPSEQVDFRASPPQLVGISSGELLTVASQRHSGTGASRVHVTQYRRGGSGFSRRWDQPLPLPRLIGLTSDGTNFYAVSAASEDLESDATIVAYRPNVLIMSKLDGQGNVLWQRDLNTAEYLGSSAGSAIYSPLKAGSAAVAYCEAEGCNKIVVALATNTLPDLKLTGRVRRHQRAQYFVVGSDGSGFQAASETSWRHSFDQRLVFDGQDFVFMDVGDAGWYMPGAGIALRKIKPTASGAAFIGGLQGVYVYMRLGDTSTQNFTFTSLGDLALSDDRAGYVALFTSEK
ncbi:MAG: hypothetical protein RL685_890, partial [Pseudomonadota bacterium]